MTSQADETAQSTRMANIPYDQRAKITIERKGQTVLIGINRPYIDNRLDPDATESLARAYYNYDRDPSLRAAVLFGYGDRFSRGIDVDAYKAFAQSGKKMMDGLGFIDPLGAPSRRSRSPWLSRCMATPGIWRTSFFLSPTYAWRRKTRSSVRTRTRTAVFPAAVQRYVSPERPDGAMRCASF
jgi:hypothetical protein